MKFSSKARPEIQKKMLDSVLIHFFGNSFYLEDQGLIWLAKNVWKMHYLDNITASFQPALENTEPFCSIQIWYKNNDVHSVCKLMASQGTYDTFFSNIDNHTLKTSCNNTVFRGGPRHVSLLMTPSRRTESTISPAMACIWYPVSYVWIFLKFKMYFEVLKVPNAGLFQVCFHEPNFESWT